MDVQITKRKQKRQNSAYLEDLVLDNLPWLRNAAFRFCRDEVEAADLFSETVCSILSRPGNFDPSRPFKPWALSVMCNIWKVAYNRAQLVSFFPLWECDREACERTDSRAKVSELRRAIRRCMGKSRTMRAVIMYAMGYSYQEIADIEQIPIGTVRSRIKSGRDLLAEEYGKPRH